MHSSLRLKLAAAVRKARRRSLIIRPLVALGIWLSVACIGAYSYHALEHEHEERAGYELDKMHMSAGLLSYPPPPPPTAPPPPWEPEHSGPGKGGGQGGGGGKGSGSGSSSGSKGSGNSGAPPHDHGHHNDNAAVAAGDCPPGGRGKSPEALGARTDNVTEELESLRGLVQSMQGQCKQLVRKSDEPNWTPSGCLFFAFQVMTTIGYGNFAPSTDGGRTLTIIFGIAGIIVTGLTLGTCAASLDALIQAYCSLDRLHLTTLILNNPQPYT